MAITRWLIDQSALKRIGCSKDVELWSERVERGLVHIAGITLLEVGWSARNAVSHARLFAGPPIDRMPIEYLTPVIEKRALEVQHELAATGRHRGPSVPDLLIAACAELSRPQLTVLHLDSDFDTIQSITGQPVERIVG